MAKEFGVKLYYGGMNTMCEEITENGATALPAVKSTTVKKTKKDKILSYKKGHVYMALKMVTPFDRNINDYGEPFPRITFLVDGRYVRMPLESDTLQELGQFMTKVGKSLEGVKVPDDSISIATVRDRIRACGGVIKDTGREIED